MSLEALAREFAHEAAVTRRHLERLPDDRFAWRPHPRSRSAGELANHLVSCLGWVEPILTRDGLDFQPATDRPREAATSAELLAAFDAAVERGQRALAAARAEDLARPWSFAVSGRRLFERPKGAVLRDFALSHVVHHRGQFSVYLRLMELPVPGSYGPSADEAR